MVEMVIKMLMITGTLLTYLLLPYIYNTIDIHSMWGSVRIHNAMRTHFS